MALLPGAQMSDDAYRLIVDDITVDATTAGRLDLPWRSSMSCSDSRVGVVCATADAKATGIFQGK